jgi:ABC-type glycerol-3-phosphate transport system permease component
MRDRSKLFIHAILMIGVVLVATPFLWMVSTSFKDSAESLQTTQFLPRSKTYHRYRDLLGEEVLVRVEVLGASQAGPLKHKIRYLRGLRKGEVREVPASEVEQHTFLWSNYSKAWNTLEPSFGTYFWNSFLVALLTTIGTLLTSALAAYAFAFFRFPGREFVFTLFLATMMVPQQLLLIPDSLILKDLGWYDTYAALVVPFLAGAFGIFLLRQFFLNVPRDLFDAAQIDGCTRLGFFFRILLPLSIPPMVTLGIFTFLASWNALLWPLVMTDDPSMRTVQVALNVFQQAEGTSWELLMAASTLTILPLVLAYFLAQRQFIQSIAGTGLKG